MQLAAIVTGNQDRVDLARRMHAGADVFATPNNCGTKGGVDCVVIATNITHAPLALAAISHIAVVVDKPLATSSEQTDQVVDSADRIPRRWDGDFTVKSLLNPGPWGRVARFESQFRTLA